MSTQCICSTNHSPLFAGAALQQRWPRLTEDDLERIDGRHHLLVERLQSRYEIDPMQAEIEARHFELSLALHHNRPEPRGQEDPMAQSAGILPPEAHPGPFPARRAVSCTAFESSPAGGR
ncbi:MAG TPA: hypothetical protein VLN90_02870 [Thioalkalivibrio sp.]|nr:hypothetical protein [Thioalkalivibrio sp.]